MCRLMAASFTLMAASFTLVGAIAPVLGRGWAEKVHNASRADHHQTRAYNAACLFSALTQFEKKRHRINNTIKVGIDGHASELTTQRTAVTSHLKNSCL